MTGVSGIYAIVHDSGALYVGSAVNLGRRWRTHLVGLRRGSHHNDHIQRAWNRHGEDGFHFAFIEECDRSNLAIREQYWMDALRPEYNILPMAWSAVGFKHTPEHRARMRGNKFALGSKRTQEERAAISAFHSGRKRTPETRAKLSVVAKNRKYSPETRAKLSASAKRPR